MTDIEENLETNDGAIERIEATLGRVMQDGKNKPFAHTCAQPSQTCECWLAVDGENRVEHIWISVRPNRRARRFEAAKRKEPKKNDGTPKRFEKIVARRPSQSSTAREERGAVAGGQDSDSLRDSAQQRTAGSGQEDR